MKIKVPQLLWHGNTEMELDFPNSWSIFFCPMKGGEKKRRGLKEMEIAFSHPIGSKTIAELAKGKREVAILFDDMARPTPVSQIVPFVLKELGQAGIKDDKVRFIAALGAPGAHRAADSQKT